ncbi:MAG: glycosyltransferase family 2 protein [Promethearchaeota archaeon]
MNGKNYPLISIIFPNWNGKKDTIECINSLRNLEYPKDRLEIIIIDNASNDGSQQIIKQKFDQLKQEGWFALILIENERNVGPTIARNRGIRAVYKNYDYIWMMDNDIVVNKDALKVMLKISETTPKIGIIGSVNYYFSNPKKICPCGGHLKLKFGRYKFIEINERDINKTDVLSVDYVFSCSLLIKKQTIQNIGLLNPYYFWGFNDIDWCIRAKKAGYEVIIAKNSKIWHKISSSTKKVSGFNTYFNTRNLIIFIKKNFSKSNYIKFLAYILIINMPWKTILFFIKGMFTQISYLYKGLVDGLVFKK